MAIGDTEIRPSFIKLFTVELGFTDAEFAMLKGKFRVKHVPERSHYLRAGDVSAYTAGHRSRPACVRWNSSRVAL